MVGSGSRTNSRIAEDKALYFLGKASISLENLRFPGSKTFVDWDNVERLKKILEAGCLPEKANHQIPAIIDVEVLKKALACSKADEKSLRRNKDYVELHLPEDLHVDCLRGQHRVLAARSINPPVRRWIVKLYSTGTRIRCCC